MFVYVCVYNDALYTYSALKYSHPLTFLHFVELQPEYKVDYIEILCHWHTHCRSQICHIVHRHVSNSMHFCCMCVCR